MNVIHHDSKVATSALTRASSRSVQWIFRIGVVAMVVLGFLHLLLLNSLATQGFVLQSIKQDRLALQQELDDWNITLATVTSLYALQSSEQVQEMDLVDHKDFVNLREDRLAMVY